MCKSYCFEEFSFNTCTHTFEQCANAHYSRIISFKAYLVHIDVNRNDNKQCIRVLRSQTLNIFRNVQFLYATDQTLISEQHNLNTRDAESQQFISFLVKIAAVRVVLFKCVEQDFHP